MQARSLYVFVALAVVAFTAAFFRSRSVPEPEPSAAAAAASSIPSASAPLASAEAAAEPEAAALDVEPPAPSAATGDPPPDPQLPADAPRQVGFGVVLIEYRGAQGASKAARSRDDAARLAEDLRAEAEKDFASAVKKGDKGSMENAGSMPRGMLEPGPERVLFGLRVGEVGGPVDTPRGYWVVKRLD